MKNSAVLVWAKAGFVAACVGLIAACGGGGSSGNAVAGPVTPAAISLVAGSLQRPGSQDGVGAAAQFNQPIGVAQDSVGNAYVADGANHTIRKIAPDGTVTTLAGTAGQAGAVDGTGTAVRFSSPSGISIDAAGNLYVADTGNHAIRKITPAGVVTTLATLPAPPAPVDSGASIRFPISVAVDAAGNIYADTGNLVRKITASGTVSIFATLQADVTAIAVDKAGNVLVATIPQAFGASLGTIFKFDSQGQPLPFGTSVNGESVLFPVGLAIDGAGNVFVASSGLAALAPNPAATITASTILKISPNAEVSTLAGDNNDSRTVDGPATAARFRDPHGISVSPSGRIVVTETETSAVRQISQGVVTTLAGGAGDGSADGQGSAARFFDPGSLAAAADGTLFVADWGNQVVRKISPSGLVSTLQTVDTHGVAAPLPGDFLEDLALDQKGTLFVGRTSGSSISSIFAIDPFGQFRFLADNSAFFNGLATDSSGAVLVTSGTAVARVNPGGTLQQLAGGFKEIFSIVASPSGVIYVADFVDNTIRAIDPQGQVTLVAGQAGQAGYADGRGSAAQFDQPSALALDAAGNLYVADAATIRKVTPDGQVRTIAGVAGQSGVQPGPALAPLGRVTGGLAWSSGALFATVQNAVIKIAPVN